MKRLYFVLLFLLFCNLTKSQNQNNDLLIVKLNVTSLLDYTPSFQMALQYNVFDNFHLQHEFGYITHYMSPFWNKKDNLRGPRFKTTLKYYVPTVSRNTPLYFGLDFLYKNIYYNTEKTYSRYEGSYFEKIVRERNKRAFAGSIICGFEPGLSNENLLIDIYFGIGFRHLTITDEAMDMHGIDERRWGIFERSEGVYRLPNFAFGVRLGYRVKRK